MGAVGSGAGKLLLFGEHAAVYGHPALGMGLPWKTSVSLKETGVAEWKLPELHPEDGHNIHKLLSFFQEVFPPFKKLGGMELKIDSDIPISMGFGSSAALCVAFLKAVVSLLARKVYLPKIIIKELNRSIDFLWHIANKAERLFHGRPSGIDTGLSLMGNIQSFSFPKNEKKLPNSRALSGSPFYLVVGAVPRESSTKELITSLGEQYQSGDLFVQEAIAELGKIAAGASKIVDRVEDGFSTSFGQLADQAQKILVELGLSSPILEQALQSGRSAGACGGKLSGAGGGGAFYLVANSKEKAFAVADAVRSTLQSMSLAEQHVVVVSQTRKGTQIISA